MYLSHDLPELDRELAGRWAGRALDAARRGEGMMCADDASIP